MRVAHLNTDDLLQLPLSSHTLFEAFLEVMPDSVVVTDDDGTILHANTPVETMFGYRHSELVGKSVELLVPAPPGREHSCPRLQGPIYIDTDAAETAAALTGRAKDGHEFPVDITLNTFDMAGKRHCVAVIRDLSALIYERERTETLLRFIQHRLIGRIERDRQQLAQDIHDSPLQELHSLDFRLVALARQPQIDGTQLHLQELHTMVQQVSHQLRDLCQELRPPTLATFGVGTAIHSFVHDMQQRYPDLQILMELADDQQRLSQFQRLTLYQICRNVFENVVRHAQTRSVCVRLQLRPDIVFLEVEDEGRGFTMPDDWIRLARAGKFGLIECAERAQAAGGYLEIAATPNEGTRVRVTIPLDIPESTEEENGSNSRPVGG